MPLSEAIVDVGQRLTLPLKHQALSRMIVCSCNVLSDHQIRNVVTASRGQPLSAQQIYDCLGCSIRCGRCAPAVKRIISEASIACAEGAPDGHVGFQAVKNIACLSLQTVSVPIDPKRSAIGIGERLVRAAS